MKAPVHRKTDYEKLYTEAKRIIGRLTPLRRDCGLICGAACCKGDENTGMRLFPHEKTTLKVKNTEDGGRLAVCSGTCVRSERPLACMIFPFFPCLTNEGEIRAEVDFRGARLCPLVLHRDEVIFSRPFVMAVKEVGELLMKNKECEKFIRETTAEIELYKKFYK